MIGKLKWYLILHLSVFIYSISMLFAKFAAQEELLSWGFIKLYSIVILLLFTYAILWQQILKHLDLATAFANKAVTIVWGIVGGKLFFNEKITNNMIIGATVVFIGIYYLVVSESDDN